MKPSKYTTYTKHYFSFLFIITSLLLVSCGKDDVSVDMEVHGSNEVLSQNAPRESQDNTVLQGETKNSGRIFIVESNNIVSISGNISEVNDILIGQWVLEGIYNKKQTAKNNSADIIFTEEVSDSSTTCKTDLLTFFDNSTLNTKNTLMSNTACDNINITGLNWEYEGGDSLVVGNGDAYGVIAIVSITPNQLVLKTVVGAGSIVNYSNFEFYNEYICFTKQN